MTIFLIINKFWQEYLKVTPKKIKIIDSYLLYIVITGVYQFIYCCLVGTFPFNSFLSGFVSSVSCFILASKYRNIFSYSENFPKEYF
jgi:oligosaccharyltransferase complex subunit epsilon